MECATCHAEYSGSEHSGGHCMACHKTFRSQKSFDKHRVGKYDPYERRCLTDAEMSTWRNTPKGWTHYKEGNPWRPAQTGTPTTSESQQR